MPHTRFTPGQALRLLAWRLGLVSLAGLVGTGVLWIVHGTVSVPPGSMLAAITILPVNVVCLVLVLRTLRAAGVRVRDLVRPAGTRVGIDVLWGLLWIVVLWLPFTAALLGVFTLTTADPFEAMATAFMSPATTLPLATPVAVVVGIVSAITFAPLNAPTEELLYRGIAQEGLERLGIAWLVIPSIAFGVQHAWFAASWQGSLAMLVAFTVWGAGSALIVRRQGRLLPILVAHGIVNLGTSLPAAVAPLLMPAVDGR